MMGDLQKAMKLATAGLKAQSGRMRVSAENLANQDSTAQTPGGDPYRRRVPTFKAVYDADAGGHTVKIGRVRQDMSPFRLKYEPGHPGADNNGFIKVPNVNGLIETVDIREAQRAYEANLNVVEGARRMATRTIDILQRR
jgi:flagellar basal-body rod protein FlgC